MHSSKPTPPGSQITQDALLSGLKQLSMHPLLIEAFEKGHCAGLDYVWLIAIQLHIDKENTLPSTQAMREKGLLDLNALCQQYQFIARLGQLDASKTLDFDHIAKTLHLIHNGYKFLPFPQEQLEQIDPLLGFDHFSLQPFQEVTGLFSKDPEVLAKLLQAVLTDHTGKLITDAQLTIGTENHDMALYIHDGLFYENTNQNLRGVKLPDFTALAEQIIEKSQAEAKTIPLTLRAYHRDSQPRVVVPESLLQQYCEISSFEDLETCLILATRSGNGFDYYLDYMTKHYPEKTLTDLATRIYTNASGQSLTLLDVAVLHSNHKVAELILSHQANPNERISQTLPLAIFKAAEKGDQKMLELLLKHGARLDLYMPGGISVLNAADHGFEKIAFHFPPTSQVYQDRVDFIGWLSTKFEQHTTLKAAPMTDYQRAYHHWHRYLQFDTDLDALKAYLLAKIETENPSKRSFFSSGYWSKTQNAHFKQVRELINTAADASTLLVNLKTVAGGKFAHLGQPSAALIAFRENVAANHVAMQPSAQDARTKVLTQPGTQPSAPYKERGHTERKSSGSLS